MLKLYNTLARKKQAFKPMHGKQVGMYTCGPTVYDYAHIGNFRAYVSQDLLKRYLQYRGYTVRHIMNLTDVDDKTIKGARAKGISLKQHTEFYSQAFFADLATLNILPPERYTKATDHVQEMVQLVKTLLEKGAAYKGQDGSIYFSIAKFKDYGKFARLDLKALQPSGRVKHDTYTKDTVSDFALWKAWDADDGDVFWETEIGKGRPGWHIECSAMAMKHLGSTLDLHAGGIDLVFPHHQNEIAQSEAATGQRFANCWFHNEHLIVNGQKMAKSLGNFYTLRDLQDNDPMALRYALLATHYRQQLNFSMPALAAAADTIDKMREFVRNLKSAADGSSGQAEAQRLVAQARSAFIAAMDDDLNIAIALAAIHRFVGQANTLLFDKKLPANDAKACLEFVAEIDAVLGLRLLESASGWQSLEQAEAWLRELIDKREQARASKNWPEADRIREEIKAKGIILEDAGTGIRWRKGER
ncbi:MAG: cysteine--tRNA ligase [Candidatus Aenigmarchaeota archaeon]|nr:cysteine--tRNA ligase [Candidatus Aenigmarchaeota archaeon]